MQGNDERIAMAGAGSAQYPRSFSELFEGRPLWDTSYAGRGPSVDCYPQCSVLVDLGQEYHISEISYMGGFHRWESSAFDPSMNVIRKATIYAWQPGGEVGSADTNNATPILD